MSGVAAGFCLLGGETLGRVENLRDRRRQGPARIICAVLQQHTGLSCWRHILIALILRFLSKLTCRCYAKHLQAALPTATYANVHLLPSPNYQLCCHASPHTCSMNWLRFCDSTAST